MTNQERREVSARRLARLVSNRAAENSQRRREEQEFQAEIQEAREHVMSASEIAEWRSARHQEWVEHDARVLRMNGMADLADRLLERNGFGVTGG